MPTQPSHPPKVLIIDDDEDIREIALMCLERDAGFVARAVSGGREGAVAARQWQPDMLLIDVVMPDLDGPATVELLAQDPETRNIPVVFLTARSDARDIERFMALGIAGVIPKPFDPIALADLVRSHFEALR